VSGNCISINSDRILALVTEGHFFRYHITRIRILITGRPFRTGITRAHAPGSRITDLITGTEQAVVRTGGIIRRVRTGIVDLVTGIHGTVHPVVAVNWRTRLAGAGSGVTGLRTVAEHAVVAVRVIHAIGWGYTLAGLRITLLIWATIHRRKDATGHRIATVGCAQIAVVAGSVIHALGWGYTLAGLRITLLIWATIHRRKDATGHRIATVGCAQIAVVAIQWCTGLAIVHRVAGLDAVTDVAVVAGSVIRRVYTGIVDLVTGIHGTVDAVIAIGRRAG
jgi:hypothetical protein